MMALALFVLIASQALAQAPAARCPNGKPLGLVVHGGAGWDVEPTHRAEYEAHIRQVVKQGADLLAGGGSSLDAVQSVILAMEDSGYYNAGKGAVRTSERKVELDASIMDGATLKAGAVAGVKTIKNPVLAARTVMDRTRHVLLAGDGADAFARRQGLTVVPPSYFQSIRPGGATHQYGTIGAVALDCAGNLAAATSTGGLTGKMPGRVGDSPLIGAGNYANNATCAVSGTGTGEYFIRTSAARDVAAQVEYTGADIASAGKATLAKIEKLGGEGGLIILDRNGNVSASITTNTRRMLYGYLTATGDAFASFDPPRE